MTNALKPLTSPSGWTLIAVLLLCIPLLVWLRWTAESYPNPDVLSSITALDDRYALITRGNFYGYRSSGATQVRLLDRRTGWTERLRSGLNSSDYLAGSRILSDGRLAWFSKGDRCGVHFYVPSTRQYTSIAVGSDDAELVADRFILYRDAESRLHWLDIQKPTRGATESNITIHRNIHPIPGSTEPIFYDIYDQTDDMPDLAPGMEMENTLSAENQAVELETTNEPTSHAPQSKWQALLERSQDLQPPPHPAHTRISLVILYRITSQGPEEVAHWPIASEPDQYPQIQANGPYAFNLSLDAQTIDVRAVDNGAIVSQIPVPKTPGTPRNIDWRANRYTVRFGAGATSQCVDATSGQSLQFDPTDTQCHCLSRAGDRYLTVASHDGQTTIGFPNSWPLRLQVRQYPSGEVLASYVLPRETYLSSSIPSNIRLTPDAQHVLVETNDERILKFEALSGQVVETIRATAWIDIACVASVVFLLAWIAGWIYTADRAAVPRVISLLVVSAVVICFMLWRLHLSGDLETTHRLAGAIIIAILIAWGAELMQHLCRPGISTWNRSGTLALYLACLLWLIGIIVRHYLRVEAVFGVMTVLLCFTLFYVGLRMAGRLPAYRETPPKRTQFSLGTMLVLTAWAAAVISYLIQNRQNLPRFTGWEWLGALALLVSGALLALACRHSSWMRYGIIPLSLGVAYVLHEHFYNTGELAGPTMVSRYAAALSIACSFQAIPLSNSLHRPMASTTALPNAHSMQ